MNAAFICADFLEQNRNTREGVFQKLTMYFFVCKGKRETAVEMYGVVFVPHTD